MRQIIIIAVAGLALAGCQTVRQDRAVKGAVIGGAAGAVIGGVAGSGSGAVVAGAVAGAAAGGIIGAMTVRNGKCYVRTSSGRLRRVACR